MVINYFFQIPIRDFPNNLKITGSIILESGIRFLSHNLMFSGEGTGFFKNNLFTTEANNPKLS